MFNLLTSAHFFPSLHIVVLGLLLLSPLVALLSPQVLKLQEDFSIILLPLVEQSAVWSRHFFTYIIILLPLVEQSAVWSRHFFTYIKLTCLWSCKFSLNVKNPSISLFLSSIVCIHLDYLRTDISGIDQLRCFISYSDSSCATGTAGSWFLGCSTLRMEHDGSFQLWLIDRE